MSKSYRVHVHDHGDQGRWLAQADFRKRPTSEQINRVMAVLGGPGRFEVRLHLVDSDGNEHLASSWLQGEYVKDPEHPTDAELAAAVKRGLASGQLVDAGEWMAHNRDATACAERRCCDDCKGES
jgi:hypothetical protein